MDNHEFTQIKNEKGTYHGYLDFIKEEINGKAGLYLIVKSKDGGNYFVFDPSESEENRIELQNSLGIHFNKKNKWCDSSPILPNQKIEFTIKIIALFLIMEKYIQLQM